MKFDPEKGQHGACDKLRSVTIDTLGNLAAVAAGCRHKISERFAIYHPGHLVAEKYAYNISSYLPDALSRRLEGRVQGRRGRIIAAEGLSFEQGIVDEHEVHLAAEVLLPKEKRPEFVPHTYTGNEADLVVHALWAAVCAVNGREAAQSLVRFADEPTPTTE